MNKRPAAIVAIPVKDEAERIAACLAALAVQRDELGRPLGPDTFGVLLVLNNCSDDTVSIVRRERDRLPYRLWVVERELSSAMAHAGWARRIAMDAAGDLLIGSDTSQPRVIMTTDADGRVGARWVAANLAAVGAGADLVAGFVRADRAEHAQLPVEVIRRGRLESRYEWLLAELLALTDPEAHDPWPRHRIASGASLAITLAAYRRVGGLPPIAAGEDRALVREVAMVDGHIRHCLAAQVVVSCRLNGRAEGGMAATIRQRVLIPELACDPTLEPAENLLRRGRWRAELRRQHLQGRLRHCERWPTLLKVSQVEADQAASMKHFGAAWATIERASSTLAHRALLPRQLPWQIAKAERVLGELRDRHHRTKPLQHVDAIEVGPALMHDPRERCRRVDETFSRLVAGERIIRLAGPVDEHDAAARYDSTPGECDHEVEITSAPVVGHLG